MKRPIHEIADEINRTWKPVHPTALPYLDAMYWLDKITDYYALDSGQGIVARFLGNAQTWRGEDARRIKKELNEMLK